MTKETNAKSIKDWLIEWGPIWLCAIFAFLIMVYGAIFKSKNSFEIYFSWSSGFFFLLSLPVYHTSFYLYKKRKYQNEKEKKTQHSKKLSTG
ncbi:MAG: hypothetical protein A3C58_01520 [Candidatus Staskawiczbacteria bacterium RIFCSPHIGHO2_02_FULL_34_10]|uniref:Uncharacterized protein n=1 Tax=Candidatus Staskawiczbacteria bacterium RIFCSPHIGHO2_02_FULL_34_10 TaxID=1802205 RepID=A0A1G2HUM0_9BACT|nr:MAG: hypothetical protein A3C58_01520 [Candidatus Staskawiczbacteria bacterium RIFCSPHIGHO2_02_FULL_34_10]